MCPRSASAPKIVCVPYGQYGWARGRKMDIGVWGRVTTAEKERVKELECEFKELRLANEILNLASVFFSQGGAQSLAEVVRAFVKEYCDEFKVESICSALQFASSAYRCHTARREAPYIELRNFASVDYWLQSLKNQIAGGLRFDALRPSATRAIAMWRVVSPVAGRLAAQTAAKVSDESDESDQRDLLPRQNAKFIS
jgi:hypothetical protein